MSFINRSKELKYLDTYYERTGSQIFVMYGAKGIGKQAILTDFIADKPYYYYKARPASEREQLYQWAKELNANQAKVPKHPQYDDIFSAITDKSKRKKVIVIDEFQFFIKNSSAFIGKLVELAHGQWNKSQVMVILLSSQVGWVENSLVGKIGEQAYELSGFLKIKELGFYDITSINHRANIRETIEAYAILGGNPGIWKHFDDKLSIEKNICQNILTPHVFLHHHAERIVADELRETGIYNTILAAIAEGNHRLNDLYQHTGFSRAKISVYLKNLMELGLVEKVFSYEIEGNDKAGKGYYRISNHFVHFHFTYLYPYQSDLQRLTPVEFYKKYILPTFKSYVTHYFKLACIARLEKWNREGALPFKFEQCGEWSGKVGMIDIVAGEAGGKILIALCNWEKPLLTYDDYEWLLFCAEKAGFSADYIYLFTAGRFDEKLDLEAKVKQNIRLIGVNDL